MTDVSLPHFEIPLRVTNGRYRVVDQDSDADVLQCARTILTTRPQTCLDDLRFGCADQTFRAGGADLDAIRVALEQHDSRIGAVLDRDPDALTRLLDDIRVGITTDEEGR